MKIRNVEIGDKFRVNGSKFKIAEVVDFLECKSMATGEIVGYTCIAKLMGSLATNTFDIPFSSVVRYKITA